MIKLSNGHVLRHVVASGALAFDGQGWPWERPLVALGLIKPQLFTVVIKSLTAGPLKGHLRWWCPWTCVRLVPGGAVNKIGLTNPGIDAWIKDVEPTIDFERYPIVGSIFGNAEDLVSMAIRFNGIPVKALEVNFSCPNATHGNTQVADVIKAVRRISEVSNNPLIIKLAADSDYLAIAEGLEGIAEAVSLNSVPWKVAFPNGEVTPLHRLEKKHGGGGGGVSGVPAQRANWRAVKELSEQGILPVIGPSIMCYEDLAKLDALGAQAYSYGAIHLRKPWLPTRIVEQYEKHQHERRS